LVQVEKLRHKFSFQNGCGFCILFFVRDFIPVFFLHIHGVRHHIGSFLPALPAPAAGSQMLAVVTLLFGAVAATTGPVATLPQVQVVSSPAIPMMCCSNLWKSFPSCFPPFSLN